MHALVSCVTHRAQNDHSLTPKFFYIELNFIATSDEVLIEVLILSKPEIVPPSSKTSRSLNLFRDAGDDYDAHPNSRAGNRAQSLTIGWGTNAKRFFSSEPKLCIRGVHHI
jgi:hypothetical protein